MHRCLEITELLLKIFDHFGTRGGSEDEDIPKDKDRSLQCQLFALALVSKTFSEPALDLLWRTMDTFALLIMTFPNDVWEVLGPPGGRHTLYFQRALTRKDFERFMLYAARVRYISMQDKEGPAIDTMVFTTITCAFDIYFSNSKLLPQLQGIKCADGDAIWAVYPLLSSQLLSLDITFNEPSLSIGCTTVISALSRKSPLIELLILADCPAKGLSPDIMVIVSELQQLQIIDCSMVTPSAIVHLSTLPHLRTLHFGTPREQTTTISLQNAPSHPFPSLQSIRWSTDELNRGTEFMELFMHSPVFQDLAVNLDNTVVAGDLYRIFAGLSTGTCHQSLSMIALFGSTDSNDNTNPLPLLLVSDLVPLLKCPNLRQLTISIHCSTVELDDSLLKAMAEAWPKMLYLDLAADPDAGATWSSKCTLRGLLHLARHCHNLIELGVVIAASKKVQWNGRPGNGVVCKSLTELTVGNAPIGGNSIAVASFLSAVFPSLNSITAWVQYAADVPANVESKQKWQRAIDMYHVLVKTRREERDWVTSKRTANGGQCASCRNKGLLSGQT